jgi:hypothetical protein
VGISFIRRFSNSREESIWQDIFMAKYSTYLRYYPQAKSLSEKEEGVARERQRYREIERKLRVREKQPRKATEECSDSVVIFGFKSCPCRQLKPSCTLCCILFSPSQLDSPNMPDTYENARSFDAFFPSPNLEASKLMN